MHLSTIADIRAREVPLTQKRQNHLREIARIQGCTLRFDTAADGKILALMKGGDGYDGYTGVLFWLEKYIPRMIRMGKGGMIDSNQWIDLVWCNPSDAEFLRKLELEEALDIDPGVQVPL